MNFLSVAERLAEPSQLLERDENDAGHGEVERSLKAVVPEA